MADRSMKFGRYERDGVRAEKLNGLAERIDYVEDDVEQLEEQVNQIAGGSGGQAFDPGDLGVYYENGKT